MFIISEEGKQLQRVSTIVLSAIGIFNFNIQFPCLAFDCLHFAIWYYSDEDFLEGRRHFTKAEVDGCIYDLYDDAHVKVSLKNFCLAFYEIFAISSARVHVFV